jgi:NADH-quinone oxidoreductase subunit H
VAGITTEYSGMYFGFFYMAEYIHTIVASTVAAALFLGGWSGPFVPGAHWMILKSLALFLFIYWLRWSLLRFRSDQLLRLCWQVLVPVGVLLVAAAAVYVNAVPGAR